MNRKGIYERQATEHSIPCPFKGDATYWSVRAGDRVAENAVWSYPEPLDAVPPVAGYLAFYHDRMDAWYEEDEQTIGHPHDPYHRVDVLQSSRPDHWGNGVVAESERPRILFETSLPPRYYLPQEDVRTERLTESDTETVCPYKGRVSYWSVTVDGERVVDAAVWGYPEPLPEATSVRGYYGFYPDKVTVEVDGQRLG